MSIRSATDLDAHIGRRIRTQRLVLKISQEELGKILGVSFQQIQKYEKGVNGLSAKRMQDVCQALNIPLAFLFDGGPGEKSAGFAKAAQASFVDDFLASSEGVALMRAFTKIRSDKVRRNFVGLAETIAND